MVARSMTTARFSRSDSTVPKSTEGLRSSRNQQLDLPVLVIDPDVRSVHPGRDVPVDVPDIVPRLVFAQVGEVHAIAQEQAPIVTLEQAIQAADDLPLQPLEDALRR